MAAQENHDSVVKYLLSKGANQTLATEVRVRRCFIICQRILVIVKFFKYIYISFSQISILFILSQIKLFNNIFIIIKYVCFYSYRTVLLH